MCQKWKLRLTTGSNGIVATGCTSLCESKRRSSTPVASSEKSAKFTPPSSTVAPSGWGRPRWKVGERSAIEQRRVRLVLVALVELNDVSFRVGDPGDAHPFDEAAHVKWTEGDLHVIPHLGELRVQVVDEERQVPHTRERRAVLLAARRRCVSFGGEELERHAAVADHDHLVGAGQVDALALEAEVLRVPPLDRERIGAVEADVVHGAHGYRHPSSSSSMILCANRWQWPPVRPVTRSRSTTTSWSVQIAPMLRASPSRLLCTTTGRPRTSSGVG